MRTQTWTGALLTVLIAFACGTTRSSERTIATAGSANLGGTAAGGKLSAQPGAGRASGGTNSAGAFDRAGSNNGGNAATSGSTTGGSTIGGSSPSAGSTSGLGPYTTDFGVAESPLSEGGKWKQDGLDWTRIITSGGLAYGTQSGSNGFDDSYAYLAGTFPANQSGSATIHLESDISAAYLEVEILLRWRDTAHNSTGYECNLAYNGQYAEIIKWPGPFGKLKSQFTFVSSGNPVSGGVHDGDVFQCDVVGNVITSRLNGKVTATGTDNSIPSGGAPGIGFYAEGGPASKKFSFTRFTGSGL